MSRPVIWTGCIFAFLISAGLAYRFIPPLLEPEPTEGEMFAALETSGLKGEGTSLRKVECSRVRQDVFECSYEIEKRRRFKQTILLRRSKGLFMKLGKHWSIRQTF